MKIVIDSDKCIEEMERMKYKINDSDYANGCNDVVDFFIDELKKIEGEAKRYNKKYNKRKTL